MKTLLNWRHQYDIARDEKEGLLAALECTDESLTQQHFTRDADINVIAERFGLTGIPSLPLDPAAFRDTTNDPDLREILDRSREARDHFNALPHKLRQRFHYSMGELWQFLRDPENADEAVRLGLLKRESSAAPPTTTPPPSASKDGANGSPDTSTTATPADGRAQTEHPPKPPKGA